MAKREYDNSKVEITGASILEYAESGIGKTRSAVTCPDPINFINVEPRDPRITLSGDPRYLTKQWKFTEFDEFDEYIDYLNELNEEYVKGNRPYKTIFYDGLTFVQSKFRLDFEDSRFDDSVSEKKRTDTLVDRFRLEMQDWGGLGSAMKRLTAALLKLSKHGVWVICTAHVDQYPKWDKSLSAAPSFQGKDYGSVFKAYFDFIGLVTPDSAGNYPPRINFYSQFGDFMAKSCSDVLTMKCKEKGPGPLEWDKIIKIITNK